MFTSVGSTLNTFFPQIRDYPDAVCQGNNSLADLNNPAANQGGGGCYAPNPTVDFSLALRPRYFLNRRWQLRGGISFLYEFTNGDFTTSRNEPRFTDPFVQLWYHGIPVFGGIKMWVAPTLSAPLSPESRARTVIATPGLLLQFARGFEHVLGGDLAIIANVTFSHPFYQYTTPEVRTPYRDAVTGQPYNPQCYGGGTGCAGQLSGFTNVANVLSWSLILTQEWGHFSPGLFYSMSHQFSYAATNVDGVNTSQNNQNVRTSSTFFAWVDYNINAWLTAEVGYSVSRFNILDGDGTYGNPIWAPRFDTRVYTQAVFTLDKLYDALFNGANSGGGIIRVQNFTRPTPFARF